MSKNQYLTKETMTDLIHLLTVRKSIELKSLQSEWRHSLHSINPGDLVLQSISNISNTTSKTSNSIVKNMIGISTGFIIHKLYPKKPNGIFAKISRISIEILAGKLVATHSDKLVSIANYLFNKIISKK